MATKARKTGYAFASFDNNGMTIHLVDTCSGLDHRKISEVLTERATQHNQVLLAIDAPLGWPTVAGRELVDHRAGEPIPLSSDQLFHRYTDDFVRDLTGKRPLEVGASLIARTAHTALNLIASIRHCTGRNLEVITSAHHEAFEGIIEVYPAATAIVHSMSNTSADNNKNVDANRIVKHELRFDRSIDVDACLGNDHKRDACLCVLAAQDYVRGASVAPPPDKQQTASKEGWIWVRDSQALPRESA